MSLQKRSTKKSSDAITGVNGIVKCRKTKTTSARKTHQTDKPPKSKSNANRSKLKFGFILDEKIFGWHILNNLLVSGHKFTVCLLDFANELEQKLISLGVEIVTTPLEVWRKADVIFSFSTNVERAKALLFSEYNLIEHLNSSKHFIEMTFIDAETSNEIDSILKFHGAKYLEAQIHGTVDEARSGFLVILTAGDQTLFNLCQSCFEAISRQTFFFGAVGSACKMNLIIKMLKSVIITGVAQGIALSKDIGFKIDDFVEVLCSTNISSVLVAAKADAMIKRQYPPETTVSEMQYGLSIVQKMTHDLQHPIPVTTAVNEIFKECLLRGFGDADVSAVYETF